MSHFKNMRQKRGKKLFVRQALLALSISNAPKSSGD
jgi:hypothetical protein